jgi:hypothetical protein
MRLFLHQGSSHFQILPRSGIREFHDVGAAVEFLRPLLADARNLSAMRTLVTDSRDGRIGNDREMLEELARRIVDERLQVISCADSFFAALRNEAAAGSAAQQSQASQSAAQTTPLEDEEAAKAEKEAATQPEEKHWIEIELLDDDGVPVADELYLVEMPDGSKITGRTDSSGRARIEDVDPGTAKVSFPDLDKSAYTPS